MTENSFVFRDPPETSARGARELFVTALRSRPGQWAVYRSGMKQNTAHVNASVLRKRYPEATFVARKDEDGTYAVFGKVDL